MPNELSLVQTIAVWALPLIFAVTVHEACHGYAARALGDRTAQMLGRLTLNPVPHIDPFATLLLPAMLLLMHAPFIFGGAKPVPIDVRNLKHRRRDMALIAVAGPASNFAMALGWGLLLKVAAGMGASEGIWMGVYAMSLAGVQINVMLMVLNLLPIPPLDGSRVLASIVPESVARQLDSIERYGLIILVVLLVTGVLGRLMIGPLQMTLQLISSLLGI